MALARASATTKGLVVTHQSMTSSTLSLRPRNVRPAATALAGSTARAVSLFDPTRGESRIEMVTLDVTGRDLDQASVARRDLFTDRLDHVIEPAGGRGRRVEGAERRIGRERDDELAEVTRVDVLEALSRGPGTATLPPAEALDQ